METKINIAEILKDKPQGTKLYSRICGAVELKKIIDVRKKKSIVVKELNSNNQHRFWHNGNFFRAGQCVLQPSENMADWSKFLWKKGDVLQNNDYNTQVIFDRFTSDTYEMIRCKYWLKVDNGIERFIIETNVLTKDYFKVSEELSQCYINKIENRCGGKLNLETLEIEKKLEFKDGDIVVYGKSVAICRKIYKHTLSFYVTLNEMVGLLFADEVESSEEYRFATEEEKQQLFDALAKKGKAWDAEKKQIVDLKPKVELKPFDKVLVRHQKTEEWRANIFSHTDKTDEYHDYVCVNGRWEFCIPYEGNESLLGTTKDVEVSYGRSF
ncbi:hypothetical protein [Segatella copri]|uniref:Uncharacterized protein n=1 Tax=Segatella copri TaxID=165179 RepID=A0A3R6L1V1_9BACT|nr:hypothetical protein [Segatella copri]RHG34640.1 hypothetical protein DW263_06115 [Segatella copri]RHG38163.1 hypothetical protein DW262_04910 [Segatella copri]RHG63703.1 hypothetical protein DW250_12310 [Segatella copri]